MDMIGEDGEYLPPDYKRSSNDIFTLVISCWIFSDRWISLPFIQYIITYYIDNVY